MNTDLNQRAGQLNLWEIFRLLRQGWRWPLGGALLAGFLALTLYYLIPAKYEASAVISPARFGSLTAYSSGNFFVQGAELESAPFVIERVKQPSFYTPEIRQHCQVKDQADFQLQMSKNIKASIVKLPNPALQSTSLVKLSWSASSPQIAFNCLSEIVKTLALIHQTMTTPMVDKLRAQKKVTTDLLTRYQLDLTKLENTSTSSYFTAMEFNQKIIADNMIQNLRDSIALLRKQLAEEEAQLTEPYTQPLKQIEPIYASSEPLITFELAIILGCLCGFLLGCIGLLIRFSLSQYRQSLGD